MFGSSSSAFSHSGINDLLDSAQDQEDYIQSLNTQLDERKQRENRRYDEYESEEQQSDGQGDNESGGLSIESDFGVIGLDSDASVSTTGSVTSEALRRRRRRRERRRRRRSNRSLSPVVRPVAPSAPAQQRVHVEPVHQHFGNDGLANAGVFAGGAGGQQAVQPNDPEANERETFDPMSEDWSESIRADRLAGIDFDFCFFCTFSQCPEDREKNPHYKDMLRIFRENHGKMPFVKLAGIIRNKYNEKIRKNRPDIYLPWALLTIRDHFTKHVINADVIHNNSIRILAKMIEMKEKDGIFTRDRITKGSEGMDEKAMRTWMTLHSKLSGLLAIKSRSKSSKVLI